ncbi:MAG: Fe-S biogenesis protein NfuA [Anaerolineales bacterium]
MITITDAAKKGLAKILSEKGGGNLLGLRLAIRGGAPGAYQADFRLVKPGDERADDQVVEEGDFRVFIDPLSAPKLNGAKIDFVPTFRGPSFKIEYPQPKWEDPLAQKIQELISERINPGVASHGGYVTLLGVKGQDVFLEMGGGCQGCTMSAATLRQGIEILLREEIPEIGQIFDQTDHAAGTNPYYAVSDLGKQKGESPLVKKL